MDRCRCDDYSAAVKKLRFYTVGTYRPDIIDKYDTSRYVIAWIKNGISHYDNRFLKPKAWDRELLQKQDKLSERSRQIEEMWCPYMTPYKLDMYDTTS